MVTKDTPQLSPKDFASDQETRWCPGCGDYSILSQVKKVLSNLEMKRENTVFVSGIGCSSRFPYYLSTYGMHSIHGRAPAIATGLKVHNPDLHVWVATGDGDGLSIGGNHLIHAIRRNVDINIILFNNRIYGLTKGQASPTSELGKKTKSTPLGSVDTPLSPLEVALGAQATFVARSVDVNVKHLSQTLEKAAQHKGTSFVEIYQNCNIFNDKAFEYAADRKQKMDNVIELADGKPLIFGKDRDKGIRLNQLSLEVVTVGEGGVREDELLVHDETMPQPTLAFMLSRMRYPEYPEPIGVFRRVERPTYETMIHDQISEAQKSVGKGSLNDLFQTGETWVVKP